MGIRDRIGLSFPEAVGGGGGDAVDGVTLIEEMHYAGVSGGLIASLFTAGLSAPHIAKAGDPDHCLLYTSPSPRDRTRSRMPSFA